jgi:hypothetical protein
MQRSQDSQVIAIQTLKDSPSVAFNYSDRNMGTGYANTFSPDQAFNVFS